jgi:hypothetical protein
MNCSRQLLFLILSLFIASTCCATTQIHGGTPVTGRYIDVDYGFSVLIPSNVKAFRTPEPAPNHGFGINLSESPYSYLWVDGSYAVGDYDTEQDLPMKTIYLLRSRDATNTKIVKQSRTRMGSLSAIHLVIDYELKGTPMVSETIWALRVRTGDSVPIRYSIKLQCVKDRFRQDSDVVERLRRGWSLEPD